MSHEIDQLVSKTSKSLRFIAVFMLRRTYFFVVVVAECNFNINFLQYNMILFSNVDFILKIVW